MRERKSENSPLSKKHDVDDDDDGNDHTHTHTHIYIRG